MEATGSALAGQQILPGLRADQLDALAATASEVMFQAGQRIFADGGYVGSFWLIESGYFRSCYGGPGSSARARGPPYRRRLFAIRAKVRA